VMVVALVLVVVGWLYVAEAPVCRNEASSYVDARCEKLQREAVRRE